MKIQQGTKMLRNCSVMLFVLLMISGCASTPETTADATPTTTTTLRASPKKVTIAGTFASETLNTVVLVNGARATIIDTSWSYTANVTSAYTTLKIQIFVNGILTDQHEVSVDAGS